MPRWRNRYTHMLEEHGLNRHGGSSPPWGTRTGRGRETEVSRRRKELKTVGFQRAK